MVLNSASSLFQTLQQQLTTLAAGAGNTVATAATELMQLAQILTSLVALFP